MQNLILVTLGGGIGAAMRHLVNELAAKTGAGGFPWWTPAVNVIGSLAMGLFIGWLTRRGGPDGLRLFVATGILGGFTTFSAFSLDFAVLWERGEVSSALIYAALSVGLSLAAVFAGLWLVRSLS